VVRSVGEALFHLVECLFTYRPACILTVHACVFTSTPLADSSLSNPCVSTIVTTTRPLRLNKVWEGPLGSASMLGLMADIQGKPYTADVTANPATVEDCQVHETGRYTLLNRSGLDTYTHTHSCSHMSPPHVFSPSPLYLFSPHIPYSIRPSPLSSLPVNNTRC
jgi:hypothetical protein